MGVHIETDCSLCHTSGTYSGTPSLCVDCHQANYTGAQNPNHTAAGIPTQCDDCHTPVGWIPSDFDHITTGFELLGAHTEVPQCSDCHLGTLVEAVSECFSCHEVQYNGAPGHLRSGFPKNCLMCHNNNSWEETSFDHDQTNFPLIGVHIETDCSLCHTWGHTLALQAYVSTVTRLTIPAPRIQITLLPVSQPSAMIAIHLLAGSHRILIT